jgi:hypothetical protein
VRLGLELEVSKSTTKSTGKPAGETKMATKTTVKGQFVIRKTYGGSTSYVKTPDQRGGVWFQFVPDKNDATVFTDRKTAQDFVRIELVPFEGKTSVVESI